MTTYSYAQLEELWIQAGGAKPLAPLMAAIAMAESEGNDHAYNPSGASGLWQILGAVNSADQPHLFDPRVNAREAVLKYTTQGLGAWVTYTSGAYKQFYKGNVPPSQLPQGGGGKPPPSDGGGGGGGGFLGLGAVTGFFGNLDKAFGELWHVIAAVFNPTTYVRVAAGSAGVILLALGLVALARAAM